MPLGWKQVGIVAKNEDGAPDRQQIIYGNKAQKLDEVASDYEFISIDSTHNDIIDKDVDKILKYLN